MPRPTPIIHIGNIEEYQRKRSGSGLSREELLAEQDVMELKMTKEAAGRGVRLMGAVRAARLRAIAATRRAIAAAAAAASLRERAAAASAAAAAAAVVAAAPAIVPVSSRGRPLRPRKRWSDDSDS